MHWVLDANILIDSFKHPSSPDAELRETIESTEGHILRFSSDLERQIEGNLKGAAKEKFHEWIKTVLRGRTKNVKFKKPANVPKKLNLKIKDKNVLALALPNGSRRNLVSRDDDFLEHGVQVFIKQHGIEFYASAEEALEVFL